MLRFSLLPISLLLGLAACALPADSLTSTPSPAPLPDAFTQAAQLKRGVNLGNALEAPNEGEWGVVLQAEYFTLLHEAGFDFVRLPIRWSAHAGDEAPYTLSPAFLARVDWAVEQARNNDLAIILDFHHYEEIFAAPAKEHERFLAIWEQLAAHYRDAPDSVIFEILNEPHDQLDEKLWNTYLAEALAVIRETNPIRLVVIGIANWGGLGSMHALEVPKDPHLMLTFHYYEPFKFTHQGAEWVSDSQSWLGTTWQGTVEEKAAIENDFKAAVAWAKSYNLPLFLGEFGAYRLADPDSRAKWTAFMVQQAETYGIPWAYWEFCSGFGIYNAETNTWNQPLTQALIPPIN